MFVINKIRNFIGYIFMIPMAFFFILAAIFLTRKGKNTINRIILKALEEF